MPFHEILMWILAAGAVLGGLDRIFGNKLGLGEKFEEGLHAMGPLALSMVGIVCLTPLIARYVGPVLIPVLTALGADPAIFGAILANDMGGYALATQLAQNEQAGLFSGLIVASMLGCTIVFSIPVALGLIEKQDHPYFAKGLMIGMITLPFGALCGGWAAGYDMEMVLWNTLPVAILSVLLAVGLYFIPNGMIRGCVWFGKGLICLVTVGLAAAAFEWMTGFALLPGMAPIEDALATVGSIAVVLMGTFPVLSLLTRLLRRPLSAVGRRIGLDEVSTAGLLYTLANSIPVFGMMKDMRPRGKIVNTAWLVPATAALGDHLGFTAGVLPEAIPAVIAGKLAAGVLAVLLALLLTKKEVRESQTPAKT